MSPRVLGHSIVHGATGTGPLLPPLPLATAAETVRRITGLSPAAAAYHATAGNTFDYGGTLVIASREQAVAGDAGAQLTTAVHFVEPAVVRHDTGGLLVALGSALPAGRLTVRCDPEGLPPDGSRLRQLGHVLERAPARTAALAVARDRSVDVRLATTPIEYAFARRLCPRVVPRGRTLVLRAAGKLVGQLTWAVRTDPLDRHRHAELATISVIGDTGVGAGWQALLAGMEREVARVPGLTMRALTGGDTADAQRDALLASGWTQVWSLRGMDPWMRETP